MSVCGRRNVDISQKLMSMVDQHRGDRTRPRALTPDRRSILNVTSAWPVYERLPLAVRARGRPWRDFSLGSVVRLPEGKKIVVRRKELTEIDCITNIPSSASLARKAWKVELE